MISICFLKIVHFWRSPCSWLLQWGFAFFAPIVVLLANGVAVCACGFATFQDTNQPTDRIPKLIQDLGSEHYSTRFASQEALIDIGEPALEPLLEVATDLRAARDFEIQVAAQAIVQRIQSRLGKTFADSFREGEKELPGWDSFSRRYGDSKEHVELYAIMYEAKSAELNRFAKREVNATMVSGLVSNSAGKVGGDAVGSIATSMFLATEMMISPMGDEPYGETHLRNLLPSFYRTNVVKTIQTSSSKKQLLQLLDQLLKALPNRQVFRSSRLRLYTTYSESNFLDSMAALALDREQAVSARVEMIDAICRIEDSDVQAEVMESLETLLDDRTSVGRFLVPLEPTSVSSEVVDAAEAEVTSASDKLQWTPESAQRPVRNERLLDVEVRDVALAGVIILRGLSLEEFGFPELAISKNGKDAKPRIDSRFAGFSDSDQRKLAFEKWKLLSSRSD